MMKVIGITGGIACGKSTVAKRLQEMGYTVIDADYLARVVVEPGRPANEALKVLWPHCFKADGTMDRKAVGDLVFNDPEALKTLEAIVHPRVEEEKLRRLAECQAREEKIVFYESALITSAEGYDGLVVVTVDPSIQIRRLILRNGLSEAEARARIAAQKPRGFEPDFIVRNDGDSRDLWLQVISLVDAILARSSSQSAG